jgi:hypothetical protein
VVEHLASNAADEALRDRIHVRRSNGRPDHLGADALGRMRSTSPGPPPPPQPRFSPREAGHVRHAVAERRRQRNGPAGITALWASGPSCGRARSRALRAHWRGRQPRTRRRPSELVAPVPSAPQPRSCRRGRQRRRRRDRRRSAAAPERRTARRAVPRRSPARAPRSSAATAAGTASTARRALHGHALEVVASAAAAAIAASPRGVRGLLRARPALVVGQ